VTEGGFVAVCVPWAKSTGGVGGGLGSGAAVGSFRLRSGSRWC